MEALAHKIVSAFFNLVEIIGFISSCLVALIVGILVLAFVAQIASLFLGFFQSND